ncbi:MAG: AsnC family transcriptional regulator [Candidatus Methylomirabilis sp.]|nr:AsnC family transcriptional regulator [Deltaproteobacteria bacterium]
MAVKVDAPDPYSPEVRKIEIDDKDREIFRCIQDDMPLCERPYAEIGERVGLSEEEVIRRVRRAQDEGVIRRFGATLRHQKAGVSANGMAVYVVPPERVDELGPVMATFPEVSHCYQRPTFPGWPYTLFAMIHGPTEDMCREVARRIAEKTGIEDYRILFSTREFKKTSMEYF